MGGHESNQNQARCLNIEGHMVLGSIAGADYYNSPPVVAEGGTNRLLTQVYGCEKTAHTIFKC